MYFIISHCTVLLRLAFEVVEVTFVVHSLLAVNKTGVFIKRPNDHLPLLIEILADFVNKPEENSN